MEPLLSFATDKGYKRVAIGREKNEFLLHLHSRQFQQAD